MDIYKSPGESEEAYIWRIGQAKDKGILDMDWNEITRLINTQFRTDETEYRCESVYRKAYAQAKRFYEAGVFDSEDKDRYIQEIKDAKQELQKEKYKLFDERAALNRKIREQSRCESFIDIVKRTIDEHNPTEFDYDPKPEYSGDCDAIIHLTDVHAGMNINSVFNVFNKDILTDRLKKYLNQIYEIKTLYNAENAYLILGGDLIHGLIHLNARLETKETVVQQIMDVSDLIGNFIYELSKMFNFVEVHTTVGNHSRVDSKKENSRTKENFDLLIPYICKKSLANVYNVKFEDNLLSSDIASFEVRGHMVYATHGDKDTPLNVVNHMTAFARKAKLPLPDICYLGHRHQNGLTTVGEVKVIESGCIDGMDTFSIDSRLVGNPEQTVTIVTDEQPVKALCDIQIS